MTKRLDNETVTAGRILKVWNEKRPKFSNENKLYYVIHAERDGEEFPIMLTENELQRAIRRAERNPEDVPKKSFLNDIFD
jgi:hypothetical protein